MLDALPKTKLSPIISMGKLIKLLEALR